ncbi:MAG TPA: iron-containing alcohol dehydrogenase [Ktedonobacteraceae bacterium]|nr:iron-containing alcohol dehydrogenase [Ktedonobacteraceae bacterium]
MNEFRYTGYARQIIFGAGSISQLSEAVERFNWHRLMLCSTGSSRRNGTIATLEQMLGERLLATYEQVQAHVPDFQVSEVVARASELEIDALIGLGGGSPIGIAKAASFALEEQRRGRPARAAFPTEQPLVPVIAIPTTYAGSEMTPTYGITRQVNGSSRKITVTDVKITPKLVLYDPLLTLDLPPMVTAATGINALAHCIEALYSITRNPLSTAAAVSGIHIIINALPRCYAEGNNVEARTEMLQGAFLAGTALSNVAMALHHGLCHTLGGTAGVPHGIANSIILPHAMRFNLDATVPQLAQAADAMGISLVGRSAEAAVEEAIQRIYALIGQMNLPQHLRDVGVQETDLPSLAQVALSSNAVRNNPKPITSAAQIESVLRAAW